MYAYTYIYTQTHTHKHSVTHTHTNTQTHTHSLTPIFLARSCSHRVEGLAHQKIQGGASCRSAPSTHTHSTHTHCLFLSPIFLARPLAGIGWRDWCIEKYGEEPVVDQPPWGTGRNGHVRLPISGMPAPRFNDHVDSHPSGHDPIGAHGRRLLCRALCVRETLVCLWLRWH